MDAKIIEETFSAFFKILNTHNNKVISI